MSYALFGVLGIAACWKWGDWRHWKFYYPTILYTYIGNLVYDILTYNRQLWAFGSFVNRYPALDLAMMAVIYPSTVILFLCHYPETAFSRVRYIAAWAILYTAVEVAAFFSGGFIYMNGWNVLYSLAFNVIMFPLTRLHFKRPLLAWPISATMALLVVWWFRIPLAR